MSLDRDTTYYTFTTNPSPTDDESAGYIVNDFWTNTSTGEQFTCVNSTTGVAVWKGTTNLSPVYTPSSFFAGSVLTITNVSLIDILLTGMLLIPGAGDYILIFNTTCSSGTNQSQNIFSVYVNGARVALSNKAVTMSPVNSRQDVSIVLKITGVLALQTVDIRWKVNVASTGTAYERTLTLIKT